MRHSGILRPLLAVLLLVATAAPGAQGRKPKDAILLSEVRTLTLRAGKPRSIGVVLNRVDFDRNKYYYARYYGYNYKSYYGSAPPAA